MSATTLLTLSLGPLEVDWGKLGTTLDHSALFLPRDERQVPYYCRDDLTGSIAVEFGEGFSRPLRSVVRRLELLGYTLAGCERMYNRHVTSIPSHYAPPSLSFHEYSAVLGRTNAASVSIPEEADYDLGEYARAILGHSPFADLDSRLRELTDDDGTFFENLDPWISLRLLAENVANLDEQVIWRTGYFRELASDDEAIYRGIPPEQVWLVVTEGSSDSSILSVSLTRLVPDLADFFRFVDMSDNYPFSGTGNVVRFAQGLSRIGILNRVLIVLDNDTAGQEAFRRIAALPLPSNMHVTTLPSLEECRAFPTLGPSGRGAEDINGRAVSIELFLDLSAATDDPVVRWTSYNDSTRTYQGELLQKERHTRVFMDAVRQRQDYDCTKLTRLWDHLISECSHDKVPGSP